MKLLHVFTEEVPVPEQSYLVAVKTPNHTTPWIFEEMAGTPRTQPLTKRAIDLSGESMTQPETN